MARADVVKLLKHLKKEVTLLVVSHDLKYAFLFWIILQTQLCSCLSVRLFVIFDANN